MGRKLVCLVTLALVLGLSESLVWGLENQIKNSEFDEGLTSWNRYGTTGYIREVVSDADLSGENAVRIEITDATVRNIGITQSGLLIQPGVTYPIGFMARAEQDREMVVLLQAGINNTSWPTYLETKVKLTTVPQTFVIEYTHSGAAIGDDPGEVLYFHLMLKGPYWPMAGDGVNQKVWIDRVYFGAEPPRPRRDLATKPNPADGATDVPRDVILNWRVGEFAAAHDVYFGTSRADVAAATRANPLDVLASQGQADAGYDPNGLLEFGRNYYWRIDEVNAPPDSTIVTGNVWSFTAEPFLYPVKNIIATASSFEPGKGPENTVNGSGLDATDLHSRNSAAMWASSLSPSEPVWIQYEFDKAYKLQEMWVWNYNVEFEQYFGCGFKDVKVEYFLNGTDWTALGDFQFAQGPGQEGYAHDPPIAFAGAMAKYVKLTAKSKWGQAFPQYGLSEVRFLYLAVQARGPEPASGATGVEVDVTLNWRPGRTAASHQVYLSTDQNAVAEGTAPVETVSDHYYPAPSLELGRTYYWRVDEVNEAATPAVWEGEVWSFTAISHFVVDDFESYTDEEGTRIYETWIDGVSAKDNGSMVGHWDPPFAEQKIVHSGRQSMPLDFNNINSPFYSQAYRDFEPVQSWTGNGVTDLTLYFRGYPPAFQETAAGSYIVSSVSGDIWDKQDHLRLVCKRLNGDGTIVARVDSMTNTAAWAKAAVMVRDNLTAGSAHALLMLAPDGRTAFQNRSLGDGISDSAHGNPGAATFPHWVKLERKGNQITGYHSTDGTNWVLQTNDGGGTSANPRMIGIGTSVYIGLAVTSNNLNTPCVVEFSQVQITGNVSGSWEVADIGGSNAGNSPNSLYLAVEDSRGKKAVAVHPDPAATTKAEWTQWNVPLSELTSAGVDVTRVVKMYIGVGDQANPIPDGAGVLYIDDIRLTRR